MPPDVKSNYLKPHELNKEVTKSASHPVALYLSLSYILNIRWFVCNHSTITTVPQFFLPLPYFFKGEKQLN